MRPTFAVGIVNAIAVDDFVVFVFEEWKVELTLEPFLHHLGKFLRVFVSIDAHGENLGFFFLLFGQ